MPLIQNEMIQGEKIESKQKREKNDSQSVNQDVKENKYVVSKPEAEKLDSIEKKKNKKKQYKKRKRQKERQQENHAQLQLANIIGGLYTHQTTYQICQERIKICLSHLEVSDRFFEFLDKVIRHQMDDIQRAMEEQTHALIKNLKINEQQQAYLQLLNILCQQYQDIKESSEDIKRIVKLYNDIFDEVQYLGQKSRDYEQLERQSFSYLIGSSDTLKEIIKVGSRAALVKGGISQEVAELIYLNQIYDMENEEDDQCQQKNQQSTQHQDQEDRNEGKNKNKKKKKLKNEDLKSEFQNVMSRLNKFVIDDDRLPCCYEDHWIQKIQHDISLKINKK